MMTATPLGVGAALPMRGRHLSALLLKADNAYYLFDCGEGTQFRLAELPFKQSKLRAIFISHLHGDHYYGLLGLLSSFVLLNRQAPLTIVGPAGLSQKLSIGMDGTGFRFDVTFKELDDAHSDELYEDDVLAVSAAKLCHNVPAYGYRADQHDRRGRFDPEQARSLGITNEEDWGRLTSGESVAGPDRIVEPGDVLGPARKGASFVYATDTEPCESTVMLAKNADVLYHEATFLESERNHARRTMHSTAAEAAGVAKQANVGQLVLTHFSARYTDTSELLAEAREIFPRTIVADELVPIPVEETSEQIVELRDNR